MPQAESRRSRLRRSRPPARRQAPPGRDESEHGGTTLRSFGDRSRGQMPALASKTPEGLTPAPAIPSGGRPELARERERGWPSDDAQIGPTSTASRALAVAAGWQCPAQLRIGSPITARPSGSALGYFRAR